MNHNQNIENNLLFGYGPANEVRRKLITLWNVYSFFATYAAVDGFSPSKSNVNKGDLTILDRWILAKTNLLIQQAVAAFDVYRIDKFIRQFEQYLDDLSNWYIRRSRRRFWKSEDDADKQAAYHTLYHVLLTSIKIIAPILPFMTEEIYQNLARNTGKSSQESIHLSDYPKIDKADIDLKLIKRVDTLRKIVELGRSARNKAELKIRQPLAELCFHLDDNELVKFILDQKSIVLDELNVKIIKWVDNSNILIEREVKPNLPVIGKEHGQYLPDIKEALVAMDGNKILRDLNTTGEVTLKLQADTLVLTRDAFLVVTSSKQGFTTESDGGITVGLTTELTDQLVQEGVVRDVIRLVQIMRKNANFAVEDRINIYGSFDGTVGEAVRAYKDYFMNETLTINMAGEFKPSEYEDTFKVAGVEVRLGIDRV